MYILHIFSSCNHLNIAFFKLDKKLNSMKLHSHFRKVVRLYHNFDKSSFYNSIKLEALRKYFQNVFLSLNIFINLVQEYTQIKRTKHTSKEVFFVTWFSEFFLNDFFFRCLSVQHFLYAKF